MYTDTFFKEKTSVRGNTCAQRFVTSEGFVAGKPMKSKADAHVLVLECVCRIWDTKSFSQRQSQRRNPGVMGSSGIAEFDPTEYNRTTLRLAKQV
jgi:hypothetical protein